MNIEKYDAYYIFDMEDKSYLFDIFNMECVTIDSNLSEALKAKRIGDLDDHTTLMLQQLESAQLFFYNISEIQFMFAEKYDRIYFSLAPITKCNLQCAYCFADAGQNFTSEQKEFTPERIQDVVNFLLTTFPECDQFRLDFVSGGEPLLNPDKLFTILNVTSERFAHHNKNITYWLCTNATLLTEDILKQLDTYNVQIGISIDGNQDVNDKCRMYKNGDGTYQDIVRAIHLVQNSEKISNYIKYIWGLSVITTHTNGLVSILKHHKKLGFKNIQMKFARLNKNNPLAITHDQLPMVFNWIDDLLQCFYECLNNNDLNTPLMFLNENDHLGKILQRLIIKKPFIFRCHAGRDKFSFAPNGDIYPCDSFVGVEKYRMGDIYSGISEDIPDLFTSLSVIQRQVCKDCWARFVCGGDCFHNSYCVNSNIEIPDDTFCRIMKYMIKKSLVTLNLLYKNNKNVLGRIKHILEIRSKV